VTEIEASLEELRTGNPVIEIKAAPEELRSGDRDLSIAGGASQR
jgi:hypothetical protein